MSIYKCDTNDGKSADYKIKVGNITQKFCASCSVEMLYGAITCIQDGEQINKISVLPVK